MNNSILKFGIEVECMLNYNLVDFTRGGYHDGVLTECGWYAEKDSSLMENSGTFAIEFVSPIMTMETAEKQIDLLVDFINNRGGQTNYSCGIHVHVGWIEYKFLLRNLFSLCAINQPILYMMGGYPERILKKYCQPLNIGFQDIKNIYNFPSYIIKHFHNENHYSALNIIYLAHSGSKTTVEFRFFSEDHTHEVTKEYIISCLSSALGIFSMSADYTPEQVLKMADKYYASHKILDNFDSSLGWGEGHGIIRKNLIPDMTDKVSGNLDGAIHDSEFKKLESLYFSR